MTTNADHEPLTRRKRRVPVEPGITAVDSTHDDNLPFPPRYWWLKRLLAAAGLLLVALLGVRWWWGWNAERRLKAKIAEYQALGQPVTLEDFQLPPIPDDENAAYFLKQAAAKIIVPSNVQVDFNDSWSDLDQVCANAGDFRRLAKANREVFELADRATACKIADWEMRFATPIITTSFTDFEPQRRLARLLGGMTLYHHIANEDSLAIQRIRESDFLVKQIVGRQGCFIHLLVQSAVCAIITYDIEQIAPNLQISLSDDGSPHATPSQVRAVIADLLAEEQFRADWRQAFFGERLFALDTVRNPVANLTATIPMSTQAAWGAHAIKPVFQHDTLFMMDYNARVAEAGATLNYVTARTQVPVYPTLASGIDRFTHLISSLCLPSLETSTIYYFRGIAMRRMAAVALALRLYEVEHGARPATLDALVPDYLSSIPLDPFAPEGTPLRYLPDAPHPLLYSVNDDGTDDGGSYVVNARGGVDMNAGDLVFFLDGQRPYPPPPSPASTTQPNGLQTVVDQGEEIRDAGQDDQDQPAGDQP